jgi:hypothetical protein
MFCSAEGWLGIDDPLPGKELPQEMLEALRCCEILKSVPAVVLDPVNKDLPFPLCVRMNEAK